MFAAPSLWLLGYSDQAVVSIQAALALAQQLAHPYSLTNALFWTAVLHHLRREASLTQAHAEAAMTIATDQEFPEQLAWVTPLRGWAPCDPCLPRGYRPWLPTIAPPGLALFSPRPTACAVGCIISPRSGYD